MLVFVSYQYYLQCGVIKKAEYVIIVCIGKLVSVLAISIALTLEYCKLECTLLQNNRVNSRYQALVSIFKQPEKVLIIMRYLYS